MKTQPRLRDRKKAHTREVILRAATRLYLEAGYDATTVDQIAEASAVARRTFFRYFPRKDDTVFPHQEDRIALFRERLAELRAVLPPFAAVQAACLDLARLFVQNRAELLAQSRIVSGSPTLIARQAEYDELWETALVVALRPSPAPTAIEERHARVFAGAVMGMVRVTLDAWLLSDVDGDLVAIGQEALGWIEHGYASSRNSLGSPRESP